MRIELLRTVKHYGQMYTKGDVITITDDLGSYFCTCGWAKDLDGSVTTAEPFIDAVKLDVHSAKHVNTVKELN